MKTTKTAAYAAVIKMVSEFVVRITNDRKTANNTTATEVVTRLVVNDLCKLMINIGTISHVPLANAMINRAKWSTNGEI